MSYPTINGLSALMACLRAISLPAGFSSKDSDLFQAQPLPCNYLKNPIFASLPHQSPLIPAFTLPTSTPQHGNFAWVSVLEHQAEFLHQITLSIHTMLCMFLHQLGAILADMVSMAEDDGTDLGDLSATVIWALWLLNIANMHYLFYSCHNRCQGQESLSPAPSQAKVLFLSYFYQLVAPLKLLGFYPAWLW